MSEDDLDTNDALEYDSSSSSSSASKRSPPKRAREVIEISSDGELDVKPSKNTKTTQNTDEGCDSCPICLCPFEARAYVEGCYHSFCFYCILQWSQVTPSCPLCKGRIEALIFDVTRDLQYRRFKLSNMAGNAQSKYAEKFPTEAHRARKRIYNLKLRSLPLVSAARTVALTPSSMTEKSWQSRLSPWVERELQSILQVEDVDFVVNYIKGIAFKLPLDSPASQKMLSEFLEGDTDVFVREFSNFASSQYQQTAWDRLVKYEGELVDLTTPEGTEVIIGDEKDSPTRLPLSLDALNMRNRSRRK